MCATEKEVGLDSLVRAPFAPGRASMERDDDALVTPDLVLLQRGEARAWQQAFELLWGPAIRAARRYLADAGEAEDMAAQALQEVRTAVAGVRSWSEVGALTVVIARRRAISRRRALGARKRQAGMTMPLDEELTADESEPALSAAQRALDVQALLAALPAGQRQLLERYFLCGLTSEEVAREMGVPAATVRSQISRLLAQLRLRMEAGPRNKEASDCDKASDDKRP
jgi:RNA polymerase sigma factor (sigma-70 family)